MTCSCAPLKPLSWAAFLCFYKTWSFHWHWSPLLALSDRELFQTTAEVCCTAPGGSDAEGGSLWKSVHHWTAKQPSSPVRCSLVSPRETVRTLPFRRSKAPTCCPATAKGNKAKCCHQLCLPEQHFSASLPFHLAAVPTRLLTPHPLAPCPYLHLHEIGSWCGGIVETEILMTPKRVTGAVNEKWD